MVDKLQFWNDTFTRRSIINFVETITNKTSPKYVPPSERVATFDNDGTLWCEKPTYIQLYFTISRLKQMAEADPKLLEKLAFKAAVQDDLDYFIKLYPNDIPTLMQIVFDTHQGMSQKEFKELAYEFLTNINHPRFGVPFKQCIYQPMVELMHYLRENEFKVFIASAGGMSFVRTVSEEIYDLPREHVIGSNIAFEMRKTDGRIVLMRKPGLIEPLDDGPGKPVNIELHVGRSPIIAVGNANGDLEMMEFTESSDWPFLNLLLRHDDAEREYSYDIGAEKIKQKALERGWTIMSIKNDFKRVFTTS
jgi:phosphoserine phosphatase